jgi:hypothetical protein
LNFARASIETIKSDPDVSDFKFEKVSRFDEFVTMVKIRAKTTYTRMKTIYVEHPEGWNELIDRIIRGTLP